MPHRLTQSLINPRIGNGTDAAQAMVVFQICPEHTKGPICGWIVDFVGTTRRGDGTCIEKSEAIETCNEEKGKTLLPSGSYGCYILINYGLVVKTNGRVLGEWRKSDRHGRGEGFRPSDSIH